MTISKQSINKVQTYSKTKSFVSKLFVNLCVINFFNGLHTITFGLKIQNPNFM